MKPPSPWQKQYHLLAIILVLIFTASAVIIALERLENQGVSQLAAKKEQQSLQAVQGQSIISDQVAVDYRQLVSPIFKSIQSLIQVASQSGPVDQDQVKNLETELLGAKVPPPYQELHFGLVKLVRNLNSASGADLDWLEEQSRLLYEKYAWL